MRKLKLTKLIASTVLIASAIALNPMSASAEWKSNSTGFWYTEGSSYITGWKQISGQWYYFDSNGYMKTGWIYDNGNWYYCWGNGQMAKDTTVDGYCLNSNGAWTINKNNTENSNDFTSEKALKLAQKIKIDFYDGDVTYHVNSNVKIDDEKGDYYNKPYYDIKVTRNDTNESIAFFRIYQDGNFIV
ncbi:hypothetical protein DVW12_15270 [Clostridium botulinum]|nr:hypothetical protein [Clostridium botulinum]